MRYFTQATTSLNRQSKLQELYDFLINRQCSTGVLRHENSFFFWPKYMRYFTQATNSLNRQSKLQELYDFLIN